MITTYKGYKIKTENGKHIVLEAIPYPEADREFATMMEAMNYIDRFPTVKA